MDNQELTHHGVKGMKWGVRKAQSDSPKANYKRKIKQAKEDYKQANIARAKSKLNRDLQGPQGSTAREKAKSYVMSEAQNKAEKLKSQIDYEDAVDRAGKEYRQELRDRGQAKKEAAKAKRAERIEKGKEFANKGLGKKGKITMAAVAGTTAFAVGAFVVGKIIKKKTGSNAFSEQQLKEMGIDTIKLDRIKLNRIKLDRIDL